jgi:hypothetical protein
MMKTNKLSLSVGPSKIYRAALLLGLACAALGLQGCGQKGPLILPEPTPAASSPVKP